VLQYCIECHRESNVPALLDFQLLLRRAAFTRVRMISCPKARQLG
jgi:hypothetical protein